MAWIIGAVLTALGIVLLGLWWVLVQMPFVDGTPGLALIPGVLLTLIGIVVLIAKAVA